MIRLRNALGFTLPLLAAFTTDNHESIQADSLPPDFRADRMELVKNGNDVVDFTFVSTARLPSGRHARTDVEAWWKHLGGVEAALVAREALLADIDRMEPLISGVLDNPETDFSLQCPDVWHFDADRLIASGQNTHAAWFDEAECYGIRASVGENVMLTWLVVQAMKAKHCAPGCTPGVCVRRGDNALLQYASDQVAYDFGMYLHPLHDFYSHTNFCELNGCQRHDPALTSNAIVPWSETPEAQEAERKGTAPRTWEQPGGLRSGHFFVFQNMLNDPAFSALVGRAVQEVAALVPSNYFDLSGLAVVDVPLSTGTTAKALTELEPRVTTDPSGLAKPTTIATVNPVLDTLATTSSQATATGNTEFYLHTGVVAAIRQGSKPFQVVDGLNKDKDYGNLNYVGGGHCGAEDPTAHDMHIDGSSGFQCARSLAVAQTEIEVIRLCDLVTTVVTADGGTPADVTAVWFFITGTETCGCLEEFLPGERYWSD